MMDPAVGQSLSQFQQRIGAMEDLLRRNEGSVAAMLGRMKATEIAVTGIHRATSELIPKDIRALSEDTNAIRRRIDGVEQSTRPLISEAIGGLDNDVRSRMMASEDRTQRDIGEVQRSLMSHIGREADSTRAAVSKLNDALQDEIKEGRLTAQDARWACENVRELSKRHIEHVNATDRRMENTEQQIILTRQQLSDLIAHTVDRAVKEVREEIRITNQNHLRLQGGHDELTAVVSRFRDDTVKALSQAATNMRSLDDTAQSLETLLKAEVKMRQSKLEEMGTRLTYIEGNIAAQANVNDSKLQALDSEMARAIMGVHSTAQAETKVQLERAWRSINDLRDQLAKVQASQRGQAATLLANSAVNGVAAPSPTKSLNQQSPFGRSRSRLDADHNPSLDDDSAVEYIQLSSPSPGSVAAPTPATTPYPFLDAVLGGDGSTYNQNSATAQRRLQLQWQADIAVLKNELMHSFDTDISKANQSVLLLMEQQEEIAVVVHGLERDVSQLKSQEGRQSPTRLDRLALADYAKHEELEKLEWKLAAMIKTTTRDLAAARVDLESRMEKVAQRQRDDQLGSPLASPTKRRDEEAGLVAAAAIAAATSTNNENSQQSSTEDIRRIDSTVQALTDRTQTGFAEVDYRLHDLEDKSNTLQVLQKRLERTWNEDQEHLEACIMKLRDDLKFLAVSLGHAEDGPSANDAPAESKNNNEPKVEKSTPKPEANEKRSPPKVPTPNHHDASTTPDSAINHDRPQSSNYSDEESEHEPVETSEKGIGTSARPTPSPPPVQAKAGGSSPKPPTTPKHSIRIPKEKPQDEDDVESMGFSPKGNGSKNIGPRISTGGTEIPVVETSLDLENTSQIGSGSDREGKEEPIPVAATSKKKDSPSEAKSKTTKSSKSGVSSPRATKNQPPPAQPPASLSGTLRGIKAPQVGESSQPKAAPLPAMPKQKESGGVNTKTGYDHSAPGWARPK